MLKRCLWKRTDRIMQATLVLLVSGVLAACSEAPPVKPKPKDVAKAWEEAGAVSGWMGADEYDRFLEFEMKPDDLSDPLPAYRIRVLEAGVVSKLPDAGKPFALSLYLSPITDAFLKELAGLKSLQALELDGTLITGSGISELAELDDLQSLDLTSTQATDEGMKGVAAIQNLKTLDLFNTQVSDSGLKELAGMKSLQSLSLFSTKITDVGLKELAGLKNLQWLNLSDTKVTDLGLKELTGLESLRRLDLYDTQVTTKGLKELAKLKSLQSLDLSATQVTGLNELTGAMSLTSLILARRGNKSSPSEKPCKIDVCVGERRYISAERHISLGTQRGFIDGQSDSSALAFDGHHLGWPREPRTATSH